MEIAIIRRKGRNGEEQYQCRICHSAERSGISRLRCGCSQPIVVDKLFAMKRHAIITGQSRHQSGQVYSLRIVYRLLSV